MAADRGCTDQRMQVEAEMYRKLRNPVIKYVQHRFPEHSAEDVFHSAFLKVLEAYRADRIRDHSRIAEFAITTARNIALDSYRKVKDIPMPIHDRATRFNESGLLAKQLLTIAKRKTDAAGFEEFIWYLIGWKDEEICEKRGGCGTSTIRVRRFRLIDEIRYHVKKRHITPWTRNAAE